MVQHRSFLGFLSQTVAVFVLNHPRDYVWQALAATILEH